MVILDAHGLVVGYAGGFRTGPLDFALGPGVVHLAGPNGAGKSTLLRTLCGGQPPLAGTVRVRGRDVHRDPGARALVSWLPATPDLPGWLTVGEAWRLLAALRGAPEWTGAAACEALGVPAGLRLDAASVGQRKKAELVAALAGDPPVLLLDEVFAALDADAVRVVAGWIEAWRRDRVVVLTGHEGVHVVVDRTLLT